MSKVKKLKPITVVCDIDAEANIMSEDMFDRTFKPIKNHLDDNAALDGCMFETFGPELEFVKKQDPKRVWTYQDDDDGKPCFTSGFHFVNRIGYLVCDPPTKQDIYVELD